MVALVPLCVGTAVRALTYFLPDKQEVTAVASSPDEGIFFPVALTERFDCGELTHVKVALLSTSTIHAFARVKMDMDLFWQESCL